MDVDVYENITGELFDFILIILPFVIVAGAVPALIEILFGCINYGSSGIDFDIFTKPNVQETKEPEKPVEVNIKPVKIKPVSEVREIPKLCPYCLAVPDNDVRCSYCGIKF